MPEASPRILDLADKPGEDAEPPGGELTAYDPGRARETLRGWLAKALFCLVAAILGLMLLGMATGRIAVNDMEKFAAVLLTPILTLFGTVLGFYFGERSANRGGG